MNSDYYFGMWQQISHSLCQGVQYGGLIAFSGIKKIDFTAKNYLGILQ